MASDPDPERQAALVELLDDLVQGLLAEVGDSQQVVLGLLVVGLQLARFLADGLDLGLLLLVLDAS